MTTYKVPYLHQESDNQVIPKVTTLEASSFNEAKSRVMKGSKCVRVLNVFEEKLPNNVEKQDSYDCVQCDKTFKYFYNRRLHIESEHNDNSQYDNTEDVDNMKEDEMFECPYCGDKFDNKKSRDSHKGNCPEKE